MDFLFLNGKMIYLLTERETIIELLVLSLKMTQMLYQPEIADIQT
jgi:hypothetical protein